MRRFALTLLVVATLGGWAQNPAPQPDKDSDGVVAIASTQQAAVPPACPAEFNDSLERDGVLEGPKEATVAPKILHQTMAEFPKEEEALIRKHPLKNFNFKKIGTYKLLVDPDGDPKGFCVVTSAGSDFDIEAEKAARTYKFSPAMKDDKPVACRIAVQMNFKVR